MCSYIEIRKSVVTSVRMELAELSEVLTMDFDKFKEVAEPISHFYVSNSTASGRAFKRYLQTKSALCLAFLSLTNSLIFFQYQLHSNQTSMKPFRYSSEMVSAAVSTASF